MECDGLNVTQLIRRALTSSGASTDDASRLRAAIPGNLSVQNASYLNGTDFGLPPLTRFQSPHLTENTCHEKSDFYVVIMITVYLL